MFGSTDALGLQLFNDPVNNSLVEGIECIEVVNLFCVIKNRWFRLGEAFSMQGVMIPEAPPPKMSTDASSLRYLFPLCLEGHMKSEGG